jgi:hypothetical protein
LCTLRVSPQAGITGNEMMSIADMQSSHDGNHRLRHILS